MNPVPYLKSFNQIKPILISLAVLFTVSFVYSVFRLKFNEILTLLGVAFALVQILLSFNAINDSRVNVIQAQFDKNFAELKNISDQKDLSHEQDINKIKQSLFALETYIKNHDKSPGHQTMVSEILRIKDEIHNLRAAIAVLTKQGEIELKLRKMQKEIQLFKPRLPQQDNSKI